TNITGNLPDFPANALEFDPRGAGHTDDVVYLGTDAGVYILNDPTSASPSWATFGTGLPNSQDLDLEISPSLGILAAGTHGRGVWEISTNTGGLISGNAFDDTDNNGARGANDTPLSGITVYLDQNNNGVLDGPDISALTDTAGNYSFTSL